MIEAIMLDVDVRHGLQLAFSFRDQIGIVPSEVLQQLKHGPARHIKKFAYRYRHKIDVELVYIRRIRETQLKSFGLVITAFASVLFAVLSFAIEEEV